MIYGHQQGGRREGLQCGGQPSDLCRRLDVAYRPSGGNIVVEQHYRTEVALPYVLRSGMVIAHLKSAKAYHQHLPDFGIQAHFRCFFLL